MRTHPAQLCFSFSASAGTVADVRLGLRFRCVAALLIALSGTACRPHPREYALRGQVLAIAEDRRHLTVKHEDIPGFMPAMTMVYEVRDTAVSSLSAGDLITATLILAEGEMPYLIELKRTGHAEVPADGSGVMNPMVIGDVVPDDVLKDQDGSPRRLSSWNNAALAVTFVYTNCPMEDYCPLMDRKFAALQQAIAGDPALKGAAHLVSISFDPEHDTPAVLNAHAAKVGADPQIWSFVTGTPDALAHITSRFAVSVTRDPGAPALVHNLRTAVIDRRGRLTATYNGSGWTTEALLDDLRNAIRR